MKGTGPQPSADAMLVRELLESGDAFVSGDRLARLLGVSRAAVLKRVRSLEASGFVVDHRRGAGYRLVRVPTEPVACFIEAELLRAGLSLEVAVYDELESTQEVALAKDVSGRSGCLFVARVQKKGRGRFGRAWLSPPGGLWMSLAIPVSYEEVEPGVMTMGAGAAVVEVLRNEGIPALLKWPNDIMLADRKAGGILVTVVSEGPVATKVVFGVGLNVNVEKTDLAPLEGSATSILIETGTVLPLSPLCARVTRALVELVGNLSKEAVRDRARAVMWGAGRRVTVSLPDGTLREGVIRGIDDDFGLVLERDGEVWVVRSGEVL